MCRGWGATRRVQRLCAERMVRAKRLQGLNPCLRLVPRGSKSTLTILHREEVIDGDILQRGGRVDDATNPCNSRPGTAVTF